MSSAFSTSFHPQVSSKPVDPIRDTQPSFNVFTPHDFANSSWSSSAGPSHQTSRSSDQSMRKTPKLKKKSIEEQDIDKKSGERIALHLALDHAAVLYPDADSPFSDTIDVVNRLLPYHVFQQPTKDLETLMSTTKGKGRAIGYDSRKEISETKFALDCFKRREALQNRFQRVKLRSGKRSSPSDQAYILAQAVLDADRSEIASLNSELRALRADLERIEREKRATANPQRTMYHGSPATAATAILSAQPQYYRPYPYVYTQAYGAPPIQSNSTPTFSAPPSSSSNYTPYYSGAAIPVQLPVASLPALHALGIIPVPAASLPPDDQPQPPAVLRGSTSNGTMLSLEINVSLLHSAQMSGLAMVLNSLISKNNSGSSAGYPAIASEATTAVSNDTDS